jgi:phosphatidate cytidylyltransferase
VFVSIAVLLLGPLYVGLPLGTLAWVRDAQGPAVLIWLVAVIAISDSVQYYAGTTFGRRKLAPVVSPGKTIEGAIGGLVAAPITGALVGMWAMPDTHPIVSAFLAIGLALFGMAGDLFESLLKRSAGRKDSSTLIPGHGGVLDRIDAYLFAAPVFYLFLRYIA